MYMYSIYLCAWWKTSYQHIESEQAGTWELRGGRRVFLFKGKNSRWLRHLLDRSLLSWQLLFPTTPSCACCLSERFLFLFVSSANIVFWWWCHFLLIRFANDASCPSQLFLLAALKHEAWHPPLLITILSWAAVEVSFFPHPYLLEPLFLETFFLPTFPSLATIQKMEAEILDHKVQWHSKASNANGQARAAPRLGSTSKETGEFLTLSDQCCLANHFSWLPTLFTCRLLSSLPVFSV